MSKLTIGVLIPLTEEPEKEFAKVTNLGLNSCQLVGGDPNKITQELAARVVAAAKAAGVTISLYWCGLSGPEAWDYVDGPSTIGLVPPAYRETRTQELKRGVQIAHWLGVKDMATHAGFLPPNPKDPDYIAVVKAVKEVATECAKYDIFFDFETGQETPTVLMRLFQDVNMPNLGVNLDPANLLMYGNANPLDAVELIGKFVRGVHAKDGMYPTNGYQLGEEKPLGEGRVNFPVFVAKLKACGYSGPLTIEREITGDQQIADMRKAIALLTPLL